MYCVKVEPGTEKTRVRNYAGAFLPSYSPAVRYAVSAGKRSLIVPGYVFTLSPVGKSVLVPEEEWRVIDALSDPSLSSVNSEGVIWDGPLKGLTAASVDEKYSAVQITADLLGESRSYWIPAKIAEPGEAPAAEEEASGGEEAPAGPEEGPEGGQTPAAEEIPEGIEPGNTAPEGKKEKETRKMSKPEYTQEQIDHAIARTQEIGLRPAAEETGISWQTIASFFRKAGIPLPSRQGKPDSAPESPRKRKPRGKAKEAAPEAGMIPPGDAPAGEAGEAVTDPAELEKWKIENAVLKDQIARLEEKIARLKSALQELM